MPTKNSLTTLTLTPMTRAEAAALMKNLLGSYPSLSVHDPETYIANMTRLLSGYPLWAGEKAVVTVKRATKFLPTEAELYPALEDQVRVHRRGAEWDADAKQLVEDRLRLEGPPKETYEQLKARYGDSWGITNPDRAVRPSPFRTIDQLRAEFGDMLDRVPDAPPDPRQIGSLAKKVVGGLAQRNEEEFF